MVVHLFVAYLKIMRSFIYIALFDVFVFNFLDKVKGTIFPQMTKLMKFYTFLPNLIVDVSQKYFLIQNFLIFQPSPLFIH